MGLLNRLTDAISGGRNKIAKQEVSGILRTNPLCSNYENMFAQVRPLIDEMKVVQPFGVGRNGARLADNRTPELQVLAMPNDKMSWIDFLDSAFATWLTESELNIRVWKNRRGKVEGYSILPVGSRKTRTDGSYYFEYWGDGAYETLTDESVMTLRYSRSPRNLDLGISPASSIFIWAQIDDLLAQYQKAYFENGAVPASITFITASTQDKYNEKRKKLEYGLRGAENKNKTLYVWRQMLDDGATADEIEVKTIQGNNSTLALREIMDIVNDKLNKSIGVSNFILGDDSSAKYDNAELSDHQFTKRRVYPALLSFWTQFQFELDRIVGGLGYAIQFELEIPALTEQERAKAEIEKVRAETEINRYKARAEVNKIRTETLTAMITAGSMPSAAVRALGLDGSWQSVADGIYASVLATPVQLPSLGLDGINKTGGETCSCKQVADKNSIDNVASTCSKTLDAGIQFDITEKDEKKIYDALVDYIKAKLADDSEITTDDIEKVINEVLNKTAKQGADEGAAYLTTLLADETAVAGIGAILAGDGFHLSPEFEKKIADRTKLLVSQFEKDAALAIENALTSVEGKSANEIRKEIFTALGGDLADDLTARKIANRAALIARNETVYAFRSGRIENDKYLAEKYGLEIDLVWRSSHDSDVCPVCAAMDGTKVPLGKAFPDHKETEDGVVSWEHSSWNDHGEVPDAHPNCRCYFDEVVK